jgi:hypothetical protein
MQQVDINLRNYFETSNKMSTNESIIINRQKAQMKANETYQNNCWKSMNKCIYVRPLELFQSEIRKDGTRCYTICRHKKFPIGSFQKDTNYIRCKMVRRSFRINVIRLSLERKKLKLGLEEVARSQILPKDIIYFIKDLLF